MKSKFCKYFLVLLALLLCLGAVSGCEKRYGGDVACTYSVNNTLAKIELSSKAQKEILSVLNGIGWTDEKANCICDYRLTVGESSVEYHSECGTFVDSVNECSKTVSASKRKAINEWLALPSDVQVNEVSDVTVLSEGETVLPLRFFSWDSSYDEKNKQWLSADGSGVLDIQNSSGDYTLNDVPFLVDPEQISIQLPAEAYFSKFRVYQLSNGELVELDRNPSTELSELTELAVGTWYIALSVRKQYQFIKSELQHEVSGYEYLFGVRITQ